MAWPTLLVEVAFADLPTVALGSNTWTDVTAYVETIDIRRGRSDELGRFEAGTATIVFDNSDRRFDPIYSAGPYFGTLLPMRKVRVSATYLGTTHRLYTGFVEAWPPNYPGGLISHVAIPCVDAFKYFALKKLNGAYASEFCGDSINTWLTNISWPAADRAVFNAVSQIQAGTFVNTPALTHFQSVADVENGIFFMDGAGKTIFHPRYYRLTNSLSVSATFGDGHAQNPVVAGELPFLTMDLSFDDTNVWNEARVTRTGGVEQVATDSTSQATYFTRTLTKNLPIFTDSEALGLAQFLVGRYGTPIMRVKSITIDGQMDDTLWPHLLGRAISDRIRAIQRPLSLGATIQQDGYIESVQMHIDHDNWYVTWGLSPADSLTYWVLQDAVYGVLDVTTRLGY